MRKQKGGPERQKVTKQESGIVHLLNWLIVTFATFANFASCHFMVCGSVKFANFWIFVILANVPSGLAVNRISLRILLYLRLS